MAWAAAVGSVIGSGSEGMASAAQYQASKHERNVAWRRQQAWELMAPGLRVEGLKRAGLNPVLAATQGMTGGPGHVGMATTGGSPSFDKDSVGRAISSAKQGMMMKDQAEIVRQQMLEQREKTRQAVYETNVKEKYSMALAKAELDVVQEQMLNLVAQRGLTGARTAESEQARGRIMVDRLLMEMGIPGARAMEELYEKYPWLRQVQGTMGQGFLGSGATGAAGAVGGYLFHRGASRAKDQMEGFGSLRPGKSKRRK